MTQSDDLWGMEEQFWRGDAAFYERALAPGALMVLPDPVGVLDRQATIDSIGAGARWQGVAFHDRHVVGPGMDVAVLVYVAVADRGAGASYSARCSSTYVRAGAQWQLVLHHQTPLQRQDEGHG